MIFLNKIDLLISNPEQDPNKTYKRKAGGGRKPIPSRQIFEEHHIRAAGPGGQNLNKVSSAIQIRFDAAHSSSLPEEVKKRLGRIAGRRMTRDGILIITAREHRRQEQNRRAAINRLTELIQKAAKRPKPRKPTKISAAKKRRRREAKRRRSRIKSLRRPLDAKIRDMP